VRVRVFVKNDRHIKGVNRVEKGFFTFPNRVHPHRFNPLFLEALNCFIQIGDLFDLTSDATLKFLNDLTFDNR